MSNISTLVSLAPENTLPSWAEAQAFITAYADKFKFRMGFFDIEADGLKPTVVHCLVLTDGDTGHSLIVRTDKGVVVRSRPDEGNGVAQTGDADYFPEFTPVGLEHLRGKAAIDFAVRVLEAYANIVAHNSIGYDYPVLTRLHDLRTPFTSVRDSIVLARLLFGHVKEALDFDLAIEAKRVRKEYRECKLPVPADLEAKLFPGKLIGSHSLEAWGRRLGLHKGDYQKVMAAKGLDPWAVVNDDMVEYCYLDNRVLVRLWNDLIKPRLLGLVHTFDIPLEVRIKYPLAGSWHEHMIETSCYVDASTADLQTQVRSEGGYPLGDKLEERIVEEVKAWAKENYVAPADVLINGVKILAMPGFTRHQFPTTLGGRVLVRIPHAKRNAEAMENWGADVGPAADGLAAIRREMNLRASRRKKELIQAESITDKLFGGADRSREVHLSRAQNGTTTELLRLVRMVRIWGLGPTAKKAIRIEHDIARLMQELEENGVHLDMIKAAELKKELETKRAALEIEIKEAFKPRIRPKKWVERVYEKNGTKPGLFYYFPDQQFYNPKYQHQMVEGWVREMWGGVKHVRKRKGYTPAQHIASEIHAAGGGADPHAINCPTIEEGDCTPIEWQEVNINSRQQLAERLMTLGWVPTAFTASGLPELSDAALEIAARQFPIAEKLRLFYLIEKRLGMLVKGSQAWLRLVDAEGKLHPRINALGAITMRATHSNPNVSQVTAMKKVKKWLKVGQGVVAKKDEKTEEREDGWYVEKDVVAWGEEGEWGADCRALFIAPQGWKMVGCDLSKLELCCFAHYLGDYDGGHFARLLMSVDVHEVNRVILGFANRHDAKRFIFAMLYGAGDEKLGEIYDPTATPAQKKAYGQQFRRRLMEGVDGFAALVQAVRSFAASGTLPTIDGRLVVVRAVHAALNTLLQSLGAIIAKYWIVRAVEKLESLGLKRGWNGEYTLLIWSHDEMQLAVRDIEWTNENGVKESLPEIVKRIFVDYAGHAGVELGLNLPISGEGKIGQTWLDTH
jgi:DNA polymerase I-like protein with 3'-5' exonuclease and polymerase domains